VITFTHWAVQSFPVGWGLRQFFCTFSLLVLQGFCRILPDFRGAEQPSLPLKVLMAKGFLFVQQALVSLPLGYMARNFPAFPSADIKLPQKK
jgi:hypothetical protein